MYGRTGRELLETLDYEIAQFGREVQSSLDASTREYLGSNEAIESAISSYGSQIADLVADLRSDIKHLRSDIKQAMADLRHVLAWAIANLAGVLTERIDRVIVQLELVRQESQEIQRRLHPAWQNEQQALMLRHRAEDCLHRGLQDRARRADWLRDAREAYEASEKINPFDFTVQMGIARMMAEQDDLTSAAAQFEKAARYVAADSPRQEAEALWHLARVQHRLGHHEPARRAAEAARRLEPLTPAQNYDYARYCALTWRIGECCAALLEAMKADRAYAVLAIADDAFKLVTEDVLQAIDGARRAHESCALRLLETCRQLLDVAAVKCILTPDDVVDAGRMRADHRVSIPRYRGWPCLANSPPWVAVGAKHSRYWRPYPFAHPQRMLRPCSPTSSGRGHKSGDSADSADAVGFCALDPPPSMDLRGSAKDETPGAFQYLLEG